MPPVTERRKKKAVAAHSALPATCQAAVIESPGHASLREVPLPAVGENDVLVKVAYVGICATDLELFKGELGYYKNGLGKYPIIPGHEVSGVVARVGRGVAGMEPGTPVVMECIQTCGRCQACRSDNWIGCKERKEMGVLGRDGGYAGYVVVPGRFVHPLSPGTDLRKAAVCEPLAVVLKGLRRLERVLGPAGATHVGVIGAGPIGHLCARVLAVRGRHVHIFDENPGRLALFQGSEIQASRELGGLERFDAIVEATGNVAALRSALRTSRPGATLLLMGFPYGSQQFNFEELVGYDKTVVGSVGSSATDFEEAIRLLPRLDLGPFLTRSVPLARFQEAWDLFHTRNVLKVMIEVNPA